mmetsp:Transcript_20750/g.57651  ORF Transcript_20750/g.57651 Transcript_20750/m.57651 type:complete len:89 (+) Transcript_20750:81-347(+)
MHQKQQSRNTQALSIVARTNQMFRIERETVCSPISQQPDPSVEASIGEAVNEYVALVTEPRSEEILDTGRNYWALRSIENRETHTESV